MTADESNESFASCHFLRWPNIVNLSVVFGSRIRGIESILDAACRGLFGFRWRYLTKIARQDDRSGALSEQNGPKAQCPGGEFDE
jgi:hypothetical protein